MMVIIDPPPEHPPPLPEAKTYASAIFRLRRALQLNQPDFGRLIGVHAQTVCKWERGARLPNRLAREALARLAAERGLPFLEGR